MAFAVGASPESTAVGTDPPRSGPVARGVYDLEASQLSPLPLAVDEARFVGGAFGEHDSQVLVGDAATEAAIKALPLADYRILHLAAHGIKAQFEIIPKGGASTGKIFEAYVKNHGIDLLVMGAYRHSRLREFFLPGATYTVVGQPPCWVLMTH